MECFNFCYFYVALTSELMESLTTAQPRFLRTSWHRTVLTQTERVMQWKISDGQSQTINSSETCWNNSNKTTTWISIFYSYYTAMLIFACPVFREY